MIYKEVYISHSWSAFCLTKYSKLVVWFGCKYGIKKVLIETQHGDLKSYIAKHLSLYMASSRASKDRVPRRGGGDNCLPLWRGRNWLGGIDRESEKVVRRGRIGREARRGRRTGMEEPRPEPRGMAVAVLGYTGRRGEGRGGSPSVRGPLK
jgi:hypothetical protein